MTTVVNDSITNYSLDTSRASSKKNRKTWDVAAGRKTIAAILQDTMLQASLDTITEESGGDSALNQTSSQLSESNNVSLLLANATAESSRSACGSRQAESISESESIKISNDLRSLGSESDSSPRNLDDAIVIAPLASSSLAAPSRFKNEPRVNDHEHENHNNEHNLESAVKSMRIAKRLEHTRSKHHKKQSPSATVNDQRTAITSLSLSRPSDKLSETLPAVEIDRPRVRATNLNASTMEKPHDAEATQPNRRAKRQSTSLKQADLISKRVKRCDIVPPPQQRPLSVLQDRSLNASSSFAPNLNSSASTTLFVSGSDPTVLRPAPAVTNAAVERRQSQHFAISTIANSNKSIRPRRESMQLHAATNVVKITAAPVSHRPNDTVASSASVQLQSSTNQLQQDSARERESKRVEKGSNERNRVRAQVLLDESQKQIVSLNAVCQQLQVENAGLSSNIGLSKSLLERCQAELKEAADSNASLRVELHNAHEVEALLRLTAVRLEQELQQLRERAQSDEQVRRKLHLLLQGARGPIRILARIRPLLADESRDQEIVANALLDDQHVLEVRGALEGAHVGGKPTRKLHSFHVDRLFTPDNQQGQVHEEVAQLVTSCIDGDSVLICAYGATASGKTYTMDGPETQKPTTTPSPVLFNGKREKSSKSSYIAVSDSAYINRGIVQRSFEQVFEEIERRSVQGWSYEASVSIFEIHNNTVFDLLSDCDEVEVQGDGEIPALSNHSISSVDQAFLKLDQARNVRATAATKSNQSSSRSHLIIQLHLKATFVSPFKSHSQKLPVTTSSVLNLIDLAGSERAKKSKTTGKQFKETTMINSSLSALSLVVAAIADRSPHIPFRACKLTQVLQPHLNGDASRICFIFCLSPTEDMRDETLATLRFAAALSNVSKKTSH